VFDDEFNGGSLDTSKWSTGWQTVSGLTPGANSSEAECYDPNQVSVSSGALHLSLIQKTETCAGSSHPYASGLVSTQNKFNFTYGAVEARIYTPASGGQVANWPAFWADGQSWPADGELDVMEGLSGQACFHFHSNAGGPGGCASGSYTGWHTYGAVWASGSVTFYYDGVKVGQITNGITGQPMYLILNQAASSGYGGPQLAPSDMQVDYVRVWQ
jgi:beta-glucanase (GH16 family)